MMMNLDINIKFFFETLFQLKILHWQTKGYARHIAFGETYNDLSNLIDDYVEICMGKHGRFKLTDETKLVTVDNIKDISVIEFIQNVKSKLISLSDELSKESDTDLLNIRDEMLSKINKLAYLLTLE